MDDELQQLRQELRELRHRLRSLVDNAQDAIFIKDLEGRYTFINAAGARLVEREIEDVLGRTDTELFAPDTAAEIRAVDRMVVETGAPFTYRPTRQDFGAPRAFFTTKYPYYDAEGRLGGLMGVSHDVTEWVRAEEEARVADASFRAVVESSPDLIVVHAGGKVLYANPVAQRTLELVEGAAMPWVDADHLTEVSVRGIPLEAVQTPAHWYGRPATVLMARDLRQRLQLEARLAQTDRLATLGTLAAGVAHEVNNPLTFVLHHLEQLRLETDSPHIDPALEGAQRIARVVQDLSGLNRDEDDVQPTSVQRTLERVLSLLDNELRHRATVEVDLAPTAPVMANETRLFQVFMNLIVNASHAMDGPGANRLEVRAFQDGDDIVVEIEDTGAGIDDSLMERIFDPFVTTKPVGEGSGLGLWICNSIVSRYGGELSIESEVDLGTTVTVRLPLTEEPEDLDDPPTAPLPPTDQELRVLVVDDEPLIGEMLEAGLAALLEAEVVCCSSVREALALLDRDPAFTAIVCDLMMPELGGPELYELLQDRGLAHRMIFMTGGAFTRRSRDFLDQVDNPVITKPFRIKDVALAIKGM